MNDFDVQYVIVPRTSRANFLRDKRFRRTFDRVEKIESYIVYQPKEPTD